jgi:hypothetical protein
MGAVTNGFCAIQARDLGLGTPAGGAVLPNLTQARFATTGKITRSMRRRASLSVSMLHAKEMRI